MNTGNSSRRGFLAASLAAPAVLSATTAVTASRNVVPASAPSAQPKLVFRTLGKTGLKVTALGFGSMITSDQSVIERAADIGINYFDTARGYQNGNCERMVGAALKGRRNRVYLSTKSGATTKSEALAQLDTSLKELGVDYVDIWYLHAKSKPEDLNDELIEAQQIARKAGKIRFAGVSTHSGQKELVPAIVARKDHFDVLLTAYNFSTDPYVEDAIRLASEAGLGVVAMKVMAGGKKAKDKVLETLQHEGAMLAALKWVLRNDNVNTAIPSITDNDQLDENLKAMVQPFTPGDDRILTTRAERIRTTYCNMCGSCDGQCTSGLPVADLLRFYMYADSYGVFSLGREHFLNMPAHLQSVSCCSCSGCAVNCPRGLDVRALLSNAQECFA
jgi:predicted aldo/keto reductase-like oxidoreductase